MKVYSVFIVLCIAVFSIAKGQQIEPKQHLIRITDENDCVNLLAKRTDEGYTNGTSGDFFYIKKQTPHFFLDRWMPKAGTTTTNTFGWSLTQIMASPTSISLTIPPPNDYSYSGILFVTHSLHSSNTIKKYNIQSEIDAGIIGSPSFGEQSQKFIHNVWNCKTPNGWAYQTPTDWLLNISLGAEKSLVERNGFDITGGAKVSAGTMINKASLYSIIRIGQMNPYFDGLISQYSTAKHTQFYFVVKPALSYTAYDALYEGGVFAGLNSYYTSAKEDGTRTFEMKKTIAKVDVGFVVASGKLSISYLQKYISPAYDGRARHAVGNITVGMAW